MTAVKDIYEVRKGQFVVEYLCDFCSSEKLLRKSHYDKKTRHFCSQRCYSAYRREVMPPEEQNAYGTGNSPEERAKRRKARSDLNHALAQGKLSRRTCEVYGCGDWGEAHHDDYNKPLDVRWLCFQHHRDWHKILRSIENPELLGGRMKKQVGARKAVRPPVSVYGDVLIALARAGRGEEVRWCQHGRLADRCPKEAA